MPADTDKARPYENRNHPQALVARDAGEVARMTRWHVEAMNAAGQLVRSTVEATSQEEAAKQVRTAGQYPVKIEAGPPQPRAPAGGRTITGGRPGRTLLARMGRLSLGKVSRKKVAEFTEGFATLQEAGLPIVKSLRVLSAQERPGGMKELYADLADRVEEGNTLSEALATHPEAFDGLYVNMVRAGEAGGVLDVILMRLAEFLDKAQRLKRRVVGAMLYPTAVLAFSFLIILGIMIFVVPKFQTIFKDFKADIPSLTVALMALADFLAFHYGWLLAIGVPVGAVALLKIVGASEQGRWLIDGVKLRLPIAGTILRKTAIARLTRTLGTLLAAGVPILEAIAITGKTVGNARFAAALRKVHDAIREGEPLAAPLKASRVCPPVVIQMIDVGEETGDLDKMLLKIADKHDEQVDVLVASLMSLLEPVMVIVLGGIVGTIVVAMFLPIIKILETLGR